MPPPDPVTRSDPDLATLAESIFRILAAQFPVCLSSDEFHYFPQVQPGERQWNRWDDFSEPAVTGILDQFRDWEKHLAPFTDPPSATPDPPTADGLDAAMLLRVVRTLHGQFANLRPHERQPTLYLTIVGIGLAEAIEAGPPALAARLEGLPAFLDQAVRNLVQVPRLFCDLGVAMLHRQLAWLGALPQSDRHHRPIRKAYRRLADHLAQQDSAQTCLPTVDLYAEIARDHMGCGLSLEAIGAALDAEISETRALLEQGAAAIAPGRSWQAIVADLPRPPVPAADPEAPYRAVIDQLASHCEAVGLAASDLMAQSPVRVAAIPDYMAPVRSTAAYSMAPGHPPRGGTFYTALMGSAHQLPADLRLLTAHETYPGHHLLDTCRWRHPRPVRRQIEFPIFYEGWASFSEELLFDTGFFGGPVEALLMAKRRFWRALRGRTDLEIHTRAKSLDEAANGLIAEGLSAARAQAMVQRYALKPGYQLAYAVGRRHFRRLYDNWCAQRRDPIEFAQRVLALGEIDFDHLAHRLKKGG